MADRLSLAQFAKERGMATTADVDSHIHAGLRSKPTTKTYQHWYDAKLAELQSARDATVALYQSEVEAGHINRPADAPYLDRLRLKASGHHDNEAVRAAQRLLARLEGEGL